MSSTQAKQEIYRKNSAKGLSPQEKNAVIYEGCLAADAHWRIPIRAGQTFIVDARIDAGCDGRGWSCDNWATRSGPEGIGVFVGGSLGYPNAPIGMLIGALTQHNAGDTMTREEATRIFTNNVLLISSHYESRSPLDGFLYLIFNDTWTWGDNKGSIHLKLTLY